MNTSGTIMTIISGTRSVQCTVLASIGAIAGLSHHAHSFPQRLHFGEKPALTRSNSEPPIECFVEILLDVFSTCRMWALTVDPETSRSLHHANQTIIVRSEFTDEVVLASVWEPPRDIAKEQLLGPPRAANDHVRRWIVVCTLGVLYRLGLKQNLVGISSTLVDGQIMLSAPRNLERLSNCTAFVQRSEQ